MQGDNYEAVHREMFSESRQRCQKREGRRAVRGIRGGARPEEAGRRAAQAGTRRGLTDRPRPWSRATAPPHMHTVYIEIITSVKILRVVPPRLCSIICNLRNRGAAADWGAYRCTGMPKKGSGTVGLFSINYICQKQPTAWIQ